MTTSDHDFDPHEAMTAYWGPDCNAFEPLCPCCVAWKLFREHTRLPTFYEVTEELDANQ